VASYPAHRPRNWFKIALIILAAWIVFSIVAMVVLIIAFATA
jgi:hypothetical protein